VTWEEVRSVIDAMSPDRRAERATVLLPNNNSMPIVGSLVMKDGQLLLTVDEWSAVHMMQILDPPQPTKRS
jgi:hypothetical protein